MFTSLYIVDASMFISTSLCNSRSSTRKRYSSKYQPACKKHYLFWPEAQNLIQGDSVRCTICHKKFKHTKRCMQRMSPTSKAQFLMGPNKLSLKFLLWHTFLRAGQRPKVSRLLPTKPPGRPAGPINQCAPASLFPHPLLLVCRGHVESIGCA